jgi:hypothetical protein
LGVALLLDLAHVLVVLQVVEQRLVRGACEVDGEVEGYGVDVRLFPALLGVDWYPCGAFDGSVMMDA